MKKFLTILIVASFCLCVGYPQVVDLGDLDKFNVLNISKKFNDSNITINFTVENKFRALQIDENESDFGIYANGIKIGEAVYYDKELKEGLNNLTVDLGLNSTNLGEFWISHIGKGEQSELIIRAYLVYNLGGPFLRIYQTKSKNFTTKLLPEANGSLCNISFNLSSEWGNLSDNETEVLHKLDIIAESEKKVSLTVSVSINDATISVSEKEANLKPGENKILLSQKLPTSDLSKLIRFRNVFNWKLEIRIPDDCSEAFEQSRVFSLVVE